MRDARHGKMEALDFDILEYSAIGNVVEGDGWDR